MTDTGRTQKLLVVNGMWECRGCGAQIVDETITHDTSCAEVPCSGGELARQQIAKHGKDRYPTIGAQYSKVLDEAGELAEALIGYAGGALSVRQADELSAAVAREYADVGLALYALGDKLGVDLIACMRELVAADERSFA